MSRVLIDDGRFMAPIFEPQPHYNITGLGESYPKSGKCDIPHARRSSETGMYAQELNLNALSTAISKEAVKDTFHSPRRNATSPSTRVRMSKEERKNWYARDLWASNFTESKVDCNGCGKTYQLDPRTKYGLDRWLKHKKRCPVIAAVERMVQDSERRPTCPNVRNPIIAPKLRNRAPEFAYKPLNRVFGSHSTTFNRMDRLPSGIFNAVGQSDAPSFDHSGEGSAERSKEAIEAAEILILLSRI